MKALKITLKSMIWFSVFAIIALLLARILIADHYPTEMTDFVLTSRLRNSEKFDVEKTNIFTQDLMAPYDDPKNGNFFATAMTCVPDAGEIQACIRYNDSTLGKIAAFYGKDALPAGDGLSLFSYSLTVSYETDDDDGNYRTYPLRADEAYTSEFMMYNYVKLIFADVDFDKAIWMRVDITLRGEESVFGSIVLYEAYEIYNGQKIEYPLKPYILSEREKRRG